MLLFKPEHVEPILTGKKTETRRAWKKRRAKVGSVHLAKTNLLSKEYFTKLYIKNVRAERLRRIMHDDEAARREGYNNGMEFICAFARINKLCKEPITTKEEIMELNKKTGFLDKKVYVVKFESLKDGKKFETVSTR